MVKLAENAQMKFMVSESKIPVCEPVRGACELLGLDPLYVASEGRFIALVAPQQAELAVAVLKRSKCCESSQVIGVVSSANIPEVTLRTTLGLERILHRLPGEQLPRIC
ncbi:AIR synthase-related protein [Microbulbifer litoralis]|uniref:AIR synthase-related protein n=1 Tax=Microbulbifer litoralis TaxID=2933965 RepID=UPI003CE4EDA4